MKVNGVDVKIDISNPGLYSLGLCGSTGKTYLYKLLRGYQSILSNKDKILLFTYDSSVTQEYILNKINSFKGDIILLDRFDLYYSPEIIEALYNKNSICLMDLKDESKLRKLRFTLVRVKLYEDRIEVKP